MTTMEKNKVFIKQLHTNAINAMVAPTTSTLCNKRGEEQQLIWKKPTTGSQFQLSILYGALLADAYLYPRKGIIQIEQGGGHRDYLFWLFENLKSLTTGKLPSLVKRFDPRTGGTTQSNRFYTRAYFHKWRSEFYSSDGVKKLPDSFETDIDPISLAIWFLDDGGKSTGVKKGVFYTLDNYSQCEIELFQYTLSTRFCIQGQIHDSGRSKSGLPQRRLSITGKNCSRFYDLIRPLLVCLPQPVIKNFKKLPQV